MLLGYSFFVQAKPATELYSATVKVGSRDQKDFNKAAEKALLQVLVKNSGQTAAQIMSSLRAAQGLKSATSLILQFAYQPQAGGDSLLPLNIRFSKKHVQKLLENSGLTIWPANRPEILVLPVVQQNGYKILVNTSNAKNFSNFGGLLDENAQRFSLAVNMLSNNAVELNRLWQLDTLLLSQVVKQKQKDAVFVARIHTVDNGYLGSWTYIFNSQQQSVDVSAVSADDFVKQGFDWLAALLAKQYAVQLSKAHNETLLLLNGIDSEQKYQDALSYLSKHSLIEHVYVLEAAKENLQLSLVLKADRQQLERAFLLDKKMQPLAGNDDTALHYVW